jgi:small subunit ribosomal protein S1
MEEVLASNTDAFKTLEKGDTVEGVIVNTSKNGIWVDLGQYGSGLIVGPEVTDKNMLKEELVPGAVVSSTILDPEFEGGYAVLSMKRATKDRSWSLLSKMVKDKEVITATPIDANKGGLLIELEGVRGFLPVSQLSTEKYPRVNDKDEIQARLGELIGKPMSLIVLDADERENKLIFSEKAANKGAISKVLDKFAIGDKVSGKVTGVVDFGIFVNVDGVEGLVHISEISWDRIEDPSKIYKVGDAVDAEIIGIENDRFSLSVKRLLNDPWAEAAKGFKVGDVVEGEVTRITPFGAFVRIHDNIEALVHISELGDGHVASPSDVVEVAKRYKFTILNIDKNTHKIALSLKSAKNTKKTEIVEEKAVEEKPKKEAKKEKSSEIEEK